MTEVLSEVVDRRAGLITVSGHLTSSGADLVRGTADQLRGDGHVRVVLDLRGASAEKAAASLQDLLERSRFAQARTVAIRLDPPPEGGGETLFQPIGRLLLDAKRRNLIERLQTLPAQDGLGFYVSLAGKPPRPQA